MAVGDQFVSEARRSANSVREHMPQVDIAIATESREYDVGPFDKVIEIEQARQKVIDGRTWLIDSTIGPDLSPFEKTLYLDTDTYVCDDVSELFKLLDQYDLAIARTPSQPQLSDLPPPWHLYNCGVIAYRDSAATRELLEDWNERYKNVIKQQDQPADQPAFVRSLYHSGIRWFTLPQAYNVRITNRGSITNQVKIVHGRHPAGIEQAAKELNRTNRIRIFRKQSYRSTPILKVKDRETLRYRIEKKITEEGVVATIKRIPSFVLERLV